jgi:pantothenate kinase
VPGVETVIRYPDVVIVEGLNVLQPALAGPTAGTAWR